MCSINLLLLAALIYLFLTYYKLRLCYSLRNPQRSKAPQSRFEFATNEIKSVNFYCYKLSAWALSDFSNGPQQIQRLVKLRYVVQMHLRTQCISAYFAAYISQALFIYLWRYSTSFW